MNDIATMRAATAAEPQDVSGWLVLADALEDVGQDATVERLSARALTAMQAQGHEDRAIDWTDWLPSGSTGIGEARDRPFLFDASGFRWVDVADPEVAGEGEDDNWTTWTNSEGWEYACGWETHNRWERLWAITFHGEDGQAGTLPVRGTSGFDALEELIYSTEQGEVPAWARTAQCYPTGSEDPGEGCWYERTPDGWRLAARR